PRGDADAVSDLIECLDQLFIGHLPPSPTEHTIVVGCLQMTRIDLYGLVPSLFGLMLIFQVKVGEGTVVEIIGNRRGEFWKVARVGLFEDLFEDRLQKGSGGQQIVRSVRWIRLETAPQ